MAPVYHLCMDLAEVCGLLSVVVDQDLTPPACDCYVSGGVIKLCSELYSFTVC